MEHSEKLTITELEDRLDLLERAVKNMRESPPLDPATRMIRLEQQVFGTLCHRCGGRTIARGYDPVCQQEYGLCGTLIIRAGTKRGRPANKASCNFYKTTTKHDGSPKLSKVASPDLLMIFGPYPDGFFVAAKDGEWLVDKTTIYD